MVKLTVKVMLKDRYMNKLSFVYVDAETKEKINSMFPNLSYKDGFNTTIPNKGDKVDEFIEEILSLYKGKVVNLSFTSHKYLMKSILEHNEGEKISGTYFKFIEILP